MACNCVILDSAEAERDEIVKYLIETAGGAHAAASFLDAMDHEMGLISDLPTIHALSRVPEVADKGYRVVLVGSYVMLYRFENNTVYIAHIFNQRQDYASLV